MKRLGLYLLIAVGIVLFLSALLSKSLPPPRNMDQKFQEELLKTIGDFPSGWDHIQFDEIGDRRFRMTLIYQQLPSGMAQVKNDTHRIARATLKVLMDNDRNPHSEHIAIFVHGQKPEKGETGANLVRHFGKTMYDYNNDQLEFKEGL